MTRRGGVGYGVALVLVSIVAAVFVATLLSPADAPPVIRDRICEVSAP